MKKIWLFSIILLTGCTTILESLIESMNSETLAKYPVEDGKKIQSCEQLKKESFDFLHHAQQEAAFNGKLQKILSTADKDPVLKKLKQNAPDFMMAKLGGDDKCPLFLLFDTMSKEFSDSNSDLAFPQNYKFARKNANILEVSIGDIKLKFAKNRKNGVNTIYFRNVSSDGEVVTSKNTIQNNSFLQAICQGEEGMINLMLFYGALNNF